MPRLKWESIPSDNYELGTVKQWCQRARVTGGWLVWVCLLDEFDRTIVPGSPTLTFVPDPKQLFWA
jgi:hypothetical protein